MGKGDNPVFVLVVVLALVIYGFWSLKQNPPPAPVVDVNQPADVVESTSGRNVNTNTTAPVAPLSYAQALEKYKNARIQLDKDCQARPSNVTYKNNTSIMIDNRAPVARAVKVGSVFNIKAWGFKVVKLSSATLPVTWYVDCDKSQNVAAILIQR